MAITLFEIIKDILIENDEDIPAIWDDFVDGDQNVYYGILKAVNDENKEICSSRDWYFREKDTTFTTIVGDRTYAKPDGAIQKIRIPDDVDSLKSSTVEDSWLKQTEFNDIALSEQTGKPYEYASRGNELVLNPIPDGIYTCTAYYLTNLFAQTTANTLKAKMSLETDKSVLPDEVIPVLVYGACIRYYKKPDKNKYKHWQAMKANFIQEMNGLTKINTSDCIRIIKSYQDW